MRDNNLNKGSITQSRIRDPYADWYMVYRAEVTDHIKHWPANRKMDATGVENVNEGLTERVVI